MSEPTEKTQASQPLPECGQSKPCANALCPWPNYEQAYGLAGGGLGLYEFCSTCGKIVSKTLEKEI